MVKIRIDNINIENSVGKINDPFKFEIVFEAFEKLDEDIEWKLIYVGSASNEKYDQLLESVLVGPIPCGVHKFVLEGNPPDWNMIPKNDIIGYTVIMITSSYLNQEFCRVGYYVINEYMDEEYRENPPEEPIFERISRRIISSDPRVTIFPIKWCNDETDEFSIAHIDHNKYKDKEEDNDNNDTLVNGIDDEDDDEEEEDDDDEESSDQSVDLEEDL